MPTVSDIHSTQDAAYADFGRGRFDVVSGSKLAHIKKFAGHSILDVGCGPGAYLRVLHDAGYLADGVESNPEFVAQAKQTGAQLFSVDLDGQGLQFLPDNCYETVFALDVLEHLRLPEYVLSEMVRVASKNVIISVPAETPGELAAAGLFFSSYVDPTHLRYYTPLQLETVLAGAGLMNIRIYPTFRVQPILLYQFSPAWHGLLTFVSRLLSRFTIHEKTWSVLLGVGDKS